MKTIKLENQNVKVVTEALNAASKLEPGDYEFETNVGTCMVRKGDTRRILYRDGKMITPKALRDLLRVTPGQPEAPEPKNSGKTENVIATKQLDKKYKKKKIIKALEAAPPLKKKKLAKAILGFEKVAGKKVTGHEILSCLAEIKDDIKAGKLKALFDEL